MMYRGQDNTYGTVTGTSLEGRDAGIIRSVIGATEFGQPGRPTVPNPTISVRLRQAGPIPRAGRSDNRARSRQAGEESGYSAPPPAPELPPVPGWPSDSFEWTPNPRSMFSADYAVSIFTESYALGVF